MTKDEALKDACEMLKAISQGQTYPVQEYHDRLHAILTAAGLKFESLNV